MASMTFEEARAHPEGPFPRTVVDIDWGEIVASHRRLMGGAEKSYVGTFSLIASIEDLSVLQYANDGLLKLDRRKKWQRRRMGKVTKRAVRYYEV